MFDRSAMRFCGIKGENNNSQSDNHQAQPIAYGFGYDAGQRRCLFLTKLWHYYFAVLFEKVRLKLPCKLSKRLKFEK